MYKNLLFILLVISTALPVSELSAQDYLRVYLFRHAETELNTQSEEDPKLSELGRFRAENLFNSINEPRIDGIYSTDFKRTRQTVAPMADYYGLEIQFYTPYSRSSIEEFAEELSAKKGVFAVSGHSNTTPVLVSLLSGKPIQGIDESEYDNLYIVEIVDSVVTLTSIKYPPYIRKRSEVKGFPLDLTETQNISMSLEYRMLNREEVAGYVTWSYESINGESILVKSKDQLEQYGVDTESISEYDLLKKSQISTKIHGTYFGEEKAINVKWSGGEVNGTSKMRRSWLQPQGTITFSGTYHKSIIERTTAMQLASLIKLDESPFTFQWFDTYYGYEKLIEVTVEDSGEVTVPAGKFDTYKVSFKGGSPSQIFYITKNSPRKTVKIEIPGQPWVYELVKEDSQ